MVHPQAKPRRAQLRVLDTIRKAMGLAEKPKGPDEEVVADNPDAAWRLSKKLSAADHEKLLAVLNQYKDRVPVTFVPGQAKVAPVDVPLKEGARPFQARARRIPQALMHDLIQNLEEGLRTNMYEKSTSQWASPLVCVRKPDGSLRVCVDYTGVNAQTVPEQSAMPVPQEAWDQLKHKRVFSLIDLKSGYLQLRLTPEASAIGAFMAPPPYGLLQPLVMKEGFRNAPAIFQKTMWSFFGHLPYVFIYLDDILVASNSVEEHAEHLHEVFRIFREKNLFAHIKKSSFGKSVIKHLGHIIGNGEIRPDPKKVEAIAKAKAPRNVKELQSFLGMANFYRRFMPPELATVCTPLNKLLKKKEPWHWATAEQQAFEKIKSYLTSESVLHMPDWSIPFGLKTDASAVGIGAVLFQTVPDEDGTPQERPIAFFSRALNSAERNYSTTDRELLTIVAAVEHFRYYLYGRQATIWSDHEALKYIKSAPPEQAGRNGRWLRKLADYDLVYKYIKGDSNVVADALSRPTFVDPADLALPRPAVRPMGRNGPVPRASTVCPINHGLRSSTRQRAKVNYRMLNEGDESPALEPTRKSSRRKRSVQPVEQEVPTSQPNPKKVRFEESPAPSVPSGTDAPLGPTPSVAGPDAGLASSTPMSASQSDELAGSPPPVDPKTSAPNAEVELRQTTPTVAAPSSSPALPVVEKETTKAKETTFTPTAVQQIRAEEKKANNVEIEFDMPELERYVRDSASREQHYTYQPGRSSSPQLGAHQAH